MQARHRKHSVRIEFVAVALGAIAGACRAPSAPCATIEPAIVHVEPTEQTEFERAEATSAPLVWGGWHAVPIDPSVSSALRDAWTNWSEGGFDAALAAVNTGLSRTPRSATLFEVRGALYAALGYPRAARCDFERVTRMIPTRASAWVGLAWTNEALALSYAALDAVAEAERLGVRAPEVDLIAARALFRLRRRAQAADRYTRALEGLHPPEREVLLEAARLADVPAPLSRHALLDAADDWGLGLEAEGIGALLRLRCQPQVEQSVLACALESELDDQRLALWTQVVLRAARLEDRAPDGRARVSRAAGE